jgi:hypothetical protein
MKNPSIGGIIIFAGALLLVQITQAQEVTYLSNLEQASAGSEPVGSNSWLAAGFETGTNASGYSINSIQLAMTDASGNPDGFEVMLDSAIGSGDFFPESSLGAFNGSTNPSTAGVYVYTPASDLTLSPSTPYFIVITAGTSITDGAYAWSNTGTFPISYNPSGDWQAPIGSAVTDNYQSSDGSSWGTSGAYPQFAIDATAIPESSVSGLLALGGFFLGLRRSK